MAEPVGANRRFTPFQCKLTCSSARYLTRSNLRKSSQHGLGALALEYRCRRPRGEMPRFIRRKNMLALTSPTLSSSRLKSSSSLENVSLKRQLNIGITWHTRFRRCLARKIEKQTDEDSHNSLAGQLTQKWLASEPFILLRSGN